MTNACGGARDARHRLRPRRASRSVCVQLHQARSCEDSCSGGTDSLPVEGIPVMCGPRGRHLDERASRAPPHAFVIHAGLPSHIGECSITVVVKKNVVSPETAEQIIPSIVVVVSHANAGLPACARQSRLRGYVGERAITVVFIQMRSWRLTSGPRLFKSGTVRPR